MKCVVYKIQEILDVENLPIFGCLEYIVPENQIHVALSSHSDTDRIRVTCEDCTVSNQYLGIEDATEVEIPGNNVYYDLLFKGKNGKFTIHNKYALSRFRSTDLEVNLTDFECCDMHDILLAYPLGNLSDLTILPNLEVLMLGHEPGMWNEIYGDISILNTLENLRILEAYRIGTISGNIESLDNLKLTRLSVFNTSLTGNLSVWANKVKGIMGTSTTKVQASNTGIVVPEGVNISQCYVHFTEGQDPVINNIQ